MTIEITPYIEELVRDYRECGCEVCAHKLASHISNKVQEAIKLQGERMTEKKEIAPMYIVGNIEDGKFKQVLHYEGHSGNRLFSRKRDAVNFYSYEKRNNPNLEIHIYEITQVSDCTEDIDKSFDLGH